MVFGVFDAVVACSAWVTACSASATDVGAGGMTALLSAGAEIAGPYEPAEPDALLPLASLPIVTSIKSGSRMGSP